ncbi:potassium channel family protein [Ruegeria arenilitoris]|uniref:potassium channel family protein n=1 Tax=Ruegeria arenilitoris TaxID=1173585 RepID=UPI0020C4BBFC|nr:potassium channel family protein [Ruegeria arenilitoris]
MDQIADFSNLRTEDAESILKFGYVFPLATTNSFQPIFEFCESLILKPPANYGGPMNSLARITRGIGIAFKDGRVKGILAFTVGMIFWASVFYHYVEGWGWLDSAYFSVVTISTVGFGDFSPETAAGKIFTMLYIIVGLGVFVTAATTVADSILSQDDDDADK